MLHVESDIIKQAIIPSHLCGANNNNNNEASKVLSNCYFDTTAFKKYQNINRNFSFILHET